ncbi:TraD/TraG TraM recognition site domain-containing protein [Flavobacterium longum]|uniref:type IV secretory system conjugative DNA transfer family protein n=1 Tax=Flavobacterium longum TaxID=1299340 RepID=UPI0039ECB6D4
MKTFNLNETILNLPAENTLWTIGDAVEGVQIFGGIGSGKTSGSGRTLALKYLDAGFGGLVLTVKPDEKAFWEGYAAMTGRTNDLIIVEPRGENFFNFLHYISEGDGNTENIVDVLKTVIRASEEKAGKSDDAFWESALDMLMFNVIDLCKLAYGQVSIKRMFDIVQTLPKPDVADEEKTSPFYEAFLLAQETVMAKVSDWENAQSPNALMKLKSRADYDDVLCDAIADARILRFLDQFFLDSLLHLSDKTRSIIDFSFSGFLFRLLREPVYSLFCNSVSNFTPEQCSDGKIIIIHLPVKLYHKIGRDSQIMFKYIWQRAMEKRSIDENSRPVFLWADEAQNFLHEHDAEYQATARSSKIATVYISQNLPNYYANMGGAKSEFRVKSFLGTLNTKVFHANADIETNRYASELIGDAAFEETSQTATAAGHFSSSKTKSLKYDRLVRAEAFQSLKTGGKQNAHLTECYMLSQKRSGKAHIKIEFNQNFTV